jgi:hypothetical protein
VTHNVHGQQIRTGSHISPKSLADREEAHNNILVTTWFFNVVKLDFSEYYSDNIRKVVRSISTTRNCDSDTPTSTEKTIKNTLLDRDVLDVYRFR